MRVMLLHCLEGVLEGDGALWFLTTSNSAHICL
jgi:hypothetical protein